MSGTLQPIARDGDAWLILNGKSAQLPDVREAVECVREEGHYLAVRVTWEGGDGVRLAREASEAGIKRIIAGGGDGTVNEVVGGLMQLPRDARPILGIMPLGSANDFARGLELPLDPLEALRVALDASPHNVDVGSLGGDYFINLASGGFGAQITNSTPAPLKRLLGGGAYSLMGMLKAWNYQPYRGRLRFPGGERNIPLFLFALGNGSQAGGGQQLAPLAKVDDGLLELLLVRHFTSLREMKQLIDELENLPQSGKFVEYLQIPWVEFESESALPLNLDGEPCFHERFRAELIPGALSLAAPASSALYSHQDEG
ncbi:lipid kinase YegS [Chromohalobacter sarecensis]|uniref:Probable lipid kinase YegS-like n=1 Tax=Chromohalobacter sarecensis TaxID=245294 RepID=A0ABV9CYH5_9GAMM|nr:lipid kinase YegS [Chromohalobacter sarecensis]MCK0715446.1 lipid kinase YegS [Chromohalobacter sarecensis]